jgi:predicted NUDIX family phosphoesterase
MTSTLVVKRSEFGKYLQEGFIPGALNDGVMSIIYRKGFWVERNAQLEADRTLKQIMVYSAILNADLGKIFLYHRAKNKNYDETKLWGKLSLGVGGHTKKEKDGIVNPLINSLIREGEEEVGLNIDAHDFNPIGYINEDSDAVGSVHLGILNIVFTKEVEITIKSKENSGGRLHSWAEAEALINNPASDAEGWTKIAFPILQDIFQ